MLQIFSDEYSNADYFPIKSTYFFEDTSKYPSLTNTSANGTPNFMHMLRHLYRSKAHTKGKSFVGTKYVKTVGFHRARKCLDGSCRSQKVYPELALVHHYRKGCQRKFNDDECSKLQDDLVFDNELLTFQEKLIQRCNTTISQLKLSVS